MDYRGVAGCSFALSVCLASPAVARAERTVFLNLEPQALNNAAGNDPAQNSFATANFNGGTSDGWVALSDDDRAKLLFYFKEATFPFDLRYTFDRPAAGTYDMLVFGTDLDAAELFTDIACAPAVGLADCQDADLEDIAFMFWGCMPVAQQSDMRRIAFNGLTGLGFGWGLENLSSSGQIMGMYTVTGLEFGDECSTISGTPMCTHGGCMTGLQNSATDVMARVGARVDDGPPVVTITAPPDLSVVASDLTVRATVEDLFGGLTVSLEVVEAMQQLDDDEPPYEWNLQMPDGMWTFRVSATDADMNVVVQEVVVCVGGQECPDAGVTSSGSSGGESSSGGDESSDGGESSSGGDASSTSGGGDTGPIGPVTTTADLTAGFGGRGADTGCACRSDHGPGGAWLGLVLAALLRRRRRG
jgi:MYXO-CTERM domain-containing protein